MKIKTLTCHNCGHKWKYKATGAYSCGPCFVGCFGCDVFCCPMCGGEMGRSVDQDELDAYTSGGCHKCSYTCCGGCI